MHVRECPRHCRITTVHPIGQAQARASDYEETVPLGWVREEVIRREKETLQPPDHHLHSEGFRLKAMWTQAVVFGYRCTPYGVNTPFGKPHYTERLYLLTASTPQFNRSFCECCMTCTWDTFEPQCGTAHWTWNHSRCKE